MNRQVVLIAGAVGLLLIAFASGYGYHRDELYFLAAGQHLDWAYADQGPVTPLIARAMSEISVAPLIVLRLPSAVAAGATVLLTGVLARELGGRGRAAAIAAACAAVAPIVLFTGHLLSTSTFDLLVWTAVTWLAVHAVRTGDDRLWLIAGVVLGVGLLNKPLPAFLALGMGAGVAVAGPRRLLVSPYVWTGVAIALALWSPWIIWQTDHGWPQIDVSHSIAAGHSTSSQPWWTIVPFQLLLVSPLLAPVWIAGLVRLFGDPAVRQFRFVAWAWVVLAIVFMATGGKPYYLGGFLPILIASGAVCVDDWLERGRPGLRKASLAGAIALAGATTAIVALPLLPANRAGPVVALNPDVGETIGWPQFARTVADIYRRLPSTGRAVILTSNYGEAGAIDHYGPALGLPAVYSGHNGYWEWGPPPDRAAPVIVVGLDRRDRDTQLRDCTVAGRITNRAHVDNQEKGRHMFVCAEPRRPWSQEWPALKRLG
jgi:4-amino-4-deoxy-L-arabinose transferase-like glycosyltransferase